MAAVVMSSQKHNLGPSYGTIVHSSGRYILDQYGNPWLMAAAQLLPGLHNGSHDNINTVMSSYSAVGVNAMWMCLAPDAYIGANDNFSNNDGDLPWDAGGNYANPNATYWNKVDQVINMGANYGITMLLCPIETGGAGITHSSSQGGAACTTYGTFLGNRYATFPNIIWHHGNDFGGSASWISSQQTAANSTLIKNIVNAIRATNDTHLHTIQLNFNRSLSTDDGSSGGWASLVDLNGAYSYYQTYDCVARGYAQKKSDNSAGNGVGIKPMFLQEANYEGADNINTGTLAGNYCLRAQEYWAVLSGATGQIWGNKTVHHFLAGWQSALSTAATTQMGYWNTFFTSRKWWTLVPDTGNTFVTAGLGTYDSSTAATDGSTVPGSFVTAAIDAGGTLGIAYCPQSTTITVALSKFNWTVKARWFDPSNNTYQAIAGSPFTNSGTHNFATPGNNNDGNPDWVLVMEV